MVGSAGTRQPAESRSLACRRYCNTRQAQPLEVLKKNVLEVRSKPFLPCDSIGFFRHQLSAQTPSILFA
jgi:hypothetical protein